jgi:hypothetical protein
MAERLCKAVISLSKPTAAAAAVAPSHSAAATHAPEDIPSARNFVLKPVHA